MALDFFFRWASPYTNDEDKNTLVHHTKGEPTCILVRLFPALVRCFVPAGAENVGEMRALRVQDASFSAVPVGTGLVAALVRDTAGPVPLALEFMVLEVYSFLERARARGSHVDVWAGRSADAACAHG